MSRDKTLDCLRGLAMLQVVFVHVMYWLYSIQPTVFKSFALFEMTVFFFVTGAVNSFKDYPSYGSFCIKRVKGIMIPYYIYAAICVAIAFVCHPDPGAPTPGEVCRIILSWLVPINTQVGPVGARGPMWFYTWALWFVPVYLIAILLYPPVKKVVRRFGRMSIFLLVLVFVIVEIVFGLSLEQVPDEGGYTYVRLLADILREAAFYIIFMGAGMLYSRFRLRKKGDLVLALSVLAVSIAGLCISSLVFGQTLDMQENKFPPNHVFLFYSFAVMTVLYLAFPAMKCLYRMIARAMPPIDGLVGTFSENSMTVFLYQPFAFWGTYLILRHFDLRKTDLEPYAAILIVYPLVWLLIQLVNLVKSAAKTVTKSK